MSNVGMARVVQSSTFRLSGDERKLKACTLNYMDLADVGRKTWDLRLSYVECRDRVLSGPIAQSVEQLAFNQWVAGSSPARLTTFAKGNVVIGNWWD